MNKHIVPKTKPNETILGLSANKKPTTRLPNKKIRYCRMDRVVVVAGNVFSRRRTQSRQQ